MGPNLGGQRVSGKSARRALLMEVAMALSGNHPDPEPVIAKGVEIFGAEIVNQIANTLGRGLSAQAPPGGGLPPRPAPPMPPDGQAAVRPPMPPGGTVPGMAGGGFVGGVGGGLDDSIPAVTDGNSPAALSSGEFVIPADVVAHIGDGNTQNGSAKLSDMLSRIRAYKTGNGSQPDAIPNDMIFPS